MNQIDVVASNTHYLDHLLPIFDALPDELRGNIYMPRRLRHIETRPFLTTGLPADGGPVLAAAYQDLRRTRRPKVLVHHGAGQTYRDAPASPSYAGGPGREQIGLFLCPNGRVAERERAAYPRAEVAVVGCPKLDRYAQIPLPNNREPVVAVAFHWPCRVSQEAGWAWPTWHRTIVGLSRRMTVLGHHHPRARENLIRWWPAVGIEHVPTVEALLARADVLVVDNSSLGWEWLALGRPVVWIDDASWRSDGRGGWLPEAQHGLRFPARYEARLRSEHLSAAAVVGQPEGRAVRVLEHVVREVHARGQAPLEGVYDGPVGSFTQRAVAAILEQRSAA